MLERKELWLVSNSRYFVELTIFLKIFLIQISGPGDSGNSFYIIKNASPVLVGVVSSGIKKRKIPCKIDNFAMFTDVIQFKDWIESTIAV